MKASESPAGWAVEVHCQYVASGECVPLLVFPGRCAGSEEAEEKAAKRARSKGWKIRKMRRGWRAWCPEHRELAPRVVKW